MRAQVVLTPSESKKLMAKAILEMENVKKALSQGILAIHPSSSTYFLVDALARQCKQQIWLIGMIAPRGTCVEGKTQRVFEDDKYQDLTDPANFPFSWVFRKGKLQEGLRLSDVLDEMGSDDVYIKGVNAVDSHGYVGVLLASLAGGTIGKALAAQKKRGLHIIYVAGLEKFIPTSIRAIAQETGRDKTEDALGIPCKLLPIKDTCITELEAFKILTGVEAIPVASGGVGGAEGSVMMVIKGQDSEVKRAMEVAKEVKGAKLPKVEFPDCLTCHFPGCYFSGKQIDW